MVEQSNANCGILQFSSAIGRLRPRARPVRWRRSTPSDGSLDERYADAAQRMLDATNVRFYTVSRRQYNGHGRSSAFYIDVTKDRMYTLGARSHQRRSTQTAMYLICDGLARLLAPILPVTADDLWRHLPGRRSECVHLEDFPSVERLLAPEVLAEWQRLLNVREVVNAALEQKRKDKVIGNSLGARVVITASGPVATLLARYRAQLPMLFIVSDLALNAGTGDGPDDVRVEVEKAPGVKCDRCWRFVAHTRTEPDWAVSATAASKRSRNRASRVTCLASPSAGRDCRPRGVSRSADEMAGSHAVRGARQRDADTGTLEPHARP